MFLVSNKMRIDSDWDLMQDTELNKKKTVNEHVEMQR